MTQIPESFLRAVTAEHNVSEAEVSALLLALAGQTAESIATTLEISAAAVRKRLGSVYQKFDIAGSTPGKLEAIRNIIQERYQLSTVVNASSCYDFGEAPDVPVFFGRESELEVLEQWVNKDRCRLVGIFGMGGIGKTALSIKLAQKIQGQFEYVIWRSLRHAPSVKEIFADLIEFFSKKNEPKEVGISQLIAYLRKHRCLLVLDNVESVLLGGDYVGQYREGYEEYGELFRQVGEVPHQSCLVLTSRESPKEIVTLEGNNFKVKSLQLSGLENIAAKNIFVSKGDFFASEKDWKKLINQYAGNPLALKIVCSTIQEVFGSNISEFISCDISVLFGDIRNLLEQQFNRLSSLEKEILYWLGINCKPTSFVELQADIISTTSQPELIEALESLRRRSLIFNEKGLAKFMLQAVVMEYIISQFVNQVCEEIVSEINLENISLLKSHALVKAQTQGKVRNAQIRLILEPIIEKIINVFGNKDRIKEHLLKIIELLKVNIPLTSGYAGGNIINLLSHLEIDLSGCDFSNLKIWQAYLISVNLHNVNFTNSDLSKSVFTGIFDSILSVAFNPVNGEIVATGDADGRISFWQSTYGEQLFHWKAHSNWVRTVAFSPDGKTLVSCSDDHTVKLWDVESQKHLMTFEEHTSWVRSVAFSPDGKIVASASSDKTIRLWDIDTQRCCKVFEGHNNFVRSVAFSPDGKILASGSADQTVKLWDIKTGKCLNTLEGHNKLVQSVVFSSDGEILASCSDDKTVKLWDVQMGKLLTTLEGHTNLIHSIALSPISSLKKGGIIASCSDDKTVKLWDLQTGKLLKTLEGHSNSILSVAFSSDGKTLASGGYDKTVRFWDIETFQCIQILQGYTNWVHDLALSPDGKIIASSNDDKTVRLWNVETDECISTLEGHAGRLWSVAFSPLPGGLLASGGDDQTIRFWDIVSGQCVKVLQNSDRIRSIAFSHDGQILASSSIDCNINLWNVRTGQPFEILKGHTNWVQSISFSPDGEIIASGSDDQTLRLWNVHTGECIRVLEGHTMRIWSVAFSPILSSQGQLGGLLASGGDDKTVRLWDVQTGECCKTLVNDNWIRSVAFSPDGKIIGCACVNNTVEIWDVDTGERLRILQGHNNWVRSVTFSSDGTLFSGSQDGAIKQWNVKTGECIKTLMPKRPYEAMNIKGVSGLGEEQKNTLKELGAIED
ncbi:MAG: NB-ARC domain-containing protein [Nostoc sp. DedVER02]|uniref:WD40 domain-containing protein n=1 Tax=unclassified Nostoc TaxID=2593658 RepID=UPI002AD53ADF|nr:MULTISPECIES: NB-ARC domain-containing protein [unclassified Nostoc]MDZ7985636.1 NB-ARC domain-containing protein [Nostoc sp. DedVER02]MDZ8111292.1 NB-ARC domain-containing protein [Nostoc sp. DedVER01b]